MKRQDYSYAKEGNYSYFGEFFGGVVAGIGLGATWNTLAKYVNPIESGINSGTSVYFSDIFTSVEGVPVYLTDGGPGAAALAFQNERTTTFYRIGSGNVGWSILGNLEMDLNATRLKLAAGTSLDITDMTSGSVLFAGTGGRVSQNNASFFWDNTNVALTLGTTRIVSPATSNIFIGASAGNFTLTGDYNLCFGDSAGVGLTTGSWSVYIGHQAGQTTTTGNSNVCIGYQTGRLMVNGGALGATGEGNTYIGYVVGAVSTTAESNVGLGYAAFEAVTTGIEGTCLGSQAGRVVATANGVTHVGFQAGRLATAAKVTTLGWQAGYNNTSGANNLYLGASTDTTDGTITNSVVIGYNFSIATSNTIALGNSSVTIIRNDGNNACDLGTSSKRFKSIYFGTQAIGGDGSASAPTYSFGSAGNWGMYYSATAGVAFTVAGTSAAAADSAGFHALRYSMASAITSAADVILARDAAAVAAFKNGTTAQSLRVYGSTTGPAYTQMAHDATNGSITTTAGNLLLTPTGAGVVFSKGSAATIYAQIFNSTNSGSAHAQLDLAAGGTSGGDPYILMEIVSGGTWSWGVDNSDSDRLKASNGSAPGTNDRFYIETTGKAWFGAELEIDGALNHDGTTVGLYGVTPVARSSAYTPTNVTTDRSYDANSTTVDELADVLGTLIADLQLTGIIG